MSSNSGMFVAFRTSLESLILAVAEGTLLGASCRKDQCSSICSQKDPISQRCGPRVPTFGRCSAKAHATKPQFLLSFAKRRFLRMPWMRKRRCSSNAPEQVSFQQPPHMACNQRVGRGHRCSAAALKAVGTPKGRGRSEHNL